MAKIANRDYPGYLDPNGAEEIADTLVNEFGGRADSKEAFAQALGHSTSNSGAFAKKLGDARKYGIITSRGIEATDLGKRLANPRDRQERQVAIAEMIKNVGLIGDIYDQLNGTSPPDEFWRVLSEITGANPKDAKDAAPPIESLYSELLRVEPEEGQSSLVDHSSAESGPENTDAPSDENSGPKERADDSEIFVRVGSDEMRFGEPSDVNLDLAITFLKSKKGTVQDTVE